MLKIKYLLITLFVVAAIFVKNRVLAQDSLASQSFSLNQAQNYAFSNNYKNKKATLDIAIAQKKVWETTAIGLPQVSTEAKIQNFINLPTSLIPATAFNPSADPNQLIGVQFGTKYNNIVSLSASQLLFDGSYIVGLQAAKAYKNLSISTKAKTEIELKENVKQAYFTVLIAEENTNILNRSLTAAQTILKETEALYQEGLTEEQSVDQLSLSVNQIETSVGIAEGQINFARKLLKLQMGLDIETPIILTESLKDFTTEIIPIANFKAFDVANHIDYSMAQTNVKLMKLNLKKEKYSFLPSVSMFLNYQKQNLSNNFDFISGGRFYPMTLFGATLKLPILTSGSRIAKMSQAKMELDKSMITAKEVEQGLKYQSDLAQSNYDTNYQVYINEQENMALAKKIHNKTIKKFQEGVASSIELTQTQNQYLAAEGKYIKAILDILKSKSNLKKSYGIK